MNKIDIAGLKVDAITKQDFLEQSLKRILLNQKTFVITPYSEFLYNSFQDPKLLEVFNKADFSLADGIGIFWSKKYLSIPLTANNYWIKILQAAWQIKYSLAAIIFFPSWIKSALPEKIVGADLVWDLAKMAEENNLSIYLLGGFKDTAEKTGYQLSAVNKQLHIAGWSNKNPDDPSIAEDVNRANPDILFVAYGPTIQEKWISENLKNIDTKLAIGVGGSFDYIAGTKSAPPKIIRYSGLEWLWRLLTQPKRFKRIMNATFGLMCELWHYKVFESLPLRPNVAVVILNSQKQVLVCQRRPSENKVDIIVNKETLGGPNYWQLPQGGVDGKEDFSETAKREAFEETGLKNLSLIKISSKTHTYIWNNSLRNFWSNKNKRNKGQTQHVVYLNFNGQNSDVKVDNREFINYKWVDINELENTIHPERYGLTKIVADDLAEPTF